MQLQKVIDRPPPTALYVYKVLGRNAWFSLNERKAQYTPQRRRDSTVELSRVGGVNAPVGSRDPVYNFLCCWAIEVGDKWRHNDVIVQKVINIDQNWRSQTAMKSVWSVSKLSIESRGVYPYLPMLTNAPWSIFWVMNKKFNIKL